MTLFQPLWPTRPGVQERQRGWEAVQRAMTLALPTERERLFVAAAEAFFLDPLGSDYWLRIRRWEQASEELYAAFPDDPEATAFYALAHLGNVNEAKAAGQRLDELEAATRQAGEELFARNIQVLRLELNAWVAHVEGQRGDGTRQPAVKEHRNMSATGGSNPVARPLFQARATQRRHAADGATDAAPIGVANHVAD